jgi:hypothetical protein
MDNRKDLSLALNRLAAHVMDDGITYAKAVEVFCDKLGVGLLDVIGSRLRPALDHNEGCTRYTTIAMSCRCTCGAKIECALPPQHGR